MKRLVFIFLASLYGCVLHAQDIITKKDGTDIQAKVTEVGIDQISYKKYSNPDGPTYVIKKNEILMITYENGEREVYASDEGINAKSILPQGMMTYNTWSGKVSVGGVTMENDMLEHYFTPEDYRLYRDGKQSALVGGVIGVIGAIPLGWSLGEYVAGKDLNKGLFIGGGLVMAYGLVMNAIGENRIKEALSHYNSTLVFAPSINFDPANDFDFGLALVLSF